MGIHILLEVAVVGATGMDFADLGWVGAVNGEFVGFD